MTQILEISDPIFDEDEKLSLTIKCMNGSSAVEYEMVFNTQWYMETKDTFIRWGKGVKRFIDEARQGQQGDHILIGSLFRGM